MNLIRAKSIEKGWGLKLGELARIWVELSLALPKTHLSPPSQTKFDLKAFSFRFSPTTNLFESLSHVGFTSSLSDYLHVHLFKRSVLSLQRGERASASEGNRLRLWKWS
jgi:hypothetical protein